ncbi:MAG: alpha/beta hydrolase [Verrucomicrobiae bacterium]|nr:alpha/beta hydrolase [Verrucomicrobiae bacterium]
MSPTQRAFDRLAPLLQGELLRVNWISPGKARTVQEYSRFLITDLNLTGPCDVVGVSFGGIIAQEIAPLLDARICIVVASIGSTAELPQPWRWLRFLPTGMCRAALGFVGACASGQMFHRSNPDGEWYRWATAATLSWKPSGPSSVKCTRIHGDRDRTFPSGHLFSDHVIEGGGHLITMTHAESLAEIICHYRASKE